MFHRLRKKLIEAQNKTKENDEVNGKLTKDIRAIVYGKAGEYDGLSCYEKDDLGSYRAVTLQRRNIDKTQQKVEGMKSPTQQENTQNKGE